MYIDVVPNRTSPPAILLRESHPFTLTTRPTTIQQKAFDLLGVDVTCTQ